MTIFDWMKAYYDGNDMVAKLLKETASDEKGFGHPLCGKGCAYCCHHFQEISTLEFETAMLWIKQEKDQIGFEQVLEKAIRLVEKLSAIRGKYYPDGLIECRVGDEIFSLFAKEFHENQIPCVFLGEDSECLVYEYRPTSCRLHFQFLDKENCNPLNIGDGLSKIPGTLNLASLTKEIQVGIIEDLRMAHEKFGVEYRPLHPLVRLGKLLGLSA